MQSTELGRLLKAKRHEQNLSLKHVADITCISVSYLKAMEEGRFDRLPGPVYARAFARRYVRLLGVDEEKALVALDGFTDDAFQGKKRRKSQRQRRIRHHTVSFRGLVPWLSALLFLTTVGFLIRIIMT